MPKVVLEQNYTRIEDGKRVVSYAGEVCDVPDSLLEEHPYLAQRGEDGSLLPADAPAKEPAKSEEPAKKPAKGGKK